MTLQPNPGTSKKPTASDIAYWMGRVDGRLEELVNVVKALTIRVDRVEERIEEIDEKNYPANPKPPTPPEDESKVTFKWLVEKAFQPVIMMLIGGIISWILARGLP